jgi:hypothetical protein
MEDFQFAFPQIGESVVGVDECPELSRIEIDGHGVEPKVASAEVVFKGGRGHLGKLGHTWIAFGAGSNEIELGAVEAP